MRAVAVTVVLVLALASCSASGNSSRPGSTVDAAAQTSTSMTVGPSAQLGPTGQVVSSSDPIGVGISHLEVIDPGRVTAARPPLPGSPSRRLDLTVRYPIDAPDSADETTDAQPFGRWPLIVFAHGFAASADTYASLLHVIASAGFVVVAPEFPLASSTVPAPAIEGDEPQQARDVNFLIDLFTGPNAPTPFDQAILAGPVGVMGHSDGAQTVLLSGYAPAYLDHRIGAVVAVSGRYSTFGGRWFGAGAPPLLVIQASADELNPFSAGVELVQTDPHVAMLVAVDGVTHLGAVTDPAAVGPVGRLVADTFAASLRSDAGAQQRVSSDASQSPLRLVDSHSD